jgi:imidazolonepropionase-like amidohydrolase
MTDYGMDPAATLAAATVNAAELLGLDDVGLIETDYAADLVVLGANPREDPAAYEDPEAVIADGTRVV